MYELEYLYESLKSQSLEFQYICKLDSLFESSYDVVDAENAISETVKMIFEEADKSKLKLFDRLKLRFSKIDKILSTYKEPALKVNPVGLIYKDFCVFTPDSEIKKMYDSAIKYLNSFNPDKASEDECRKYITDSQNNVQYKKIMSIFGNGKSKFSGEEIIVKKK